MKRCSYRSDVLFLRSVVALKSVLVLIHNHAVDDAGIIVRTIFEIEFQLGAIKNDRQIAVRNKQLADVDDGHHVGMADARGVRARLLRHGDHEQGRLRPWPHSIPTISQIPTTS